MDIGSTVGGVKRAAVLVDGPPRFAIAQLAASGPVQQNGAHGTQTCKKVLLAARVQAGHETPRDVQCAVNGKVSNLLLGPAEASVEVQRAPKNQKHTV